MHKNMKKNIIIIVSFLITIIVFFALGYFIGNADVSKGITGTQRKEIITEIENRLIKAGYISLPPEKIYTLENAKVKEIGLIDNPYIIVEPSVLQDPFENLFNPEIKIVFTDDTKLEKVTRDVDEETGEESYDFITIGLNDLKIGEEVDIDSGDNIIGKSEITAEVIIRKEF
jgi:hypothetical protein